ncbi:MAG: sigma-70 family RNA polymerase sigma factor [Chloroflexi bacterium]|nr:MAG: sigma-70 family RNA polymerase sigma factor [Chloroflexota bacterium]
MSNIHQDDIDLMRRIIQQDEQALSELYTRYGAAVYSLALRIVQNHELAEEVTQDIFLKVWRQAESWRSELGKLSSWLLTLTRNAAIDRLRRQQRRPQAAHQSLDDFLPYLVDENIANDPQWHDGRIIRELLKTLPEEQAQAIELAFFQGYSHSQLAEALQLPLGTVKTRVRLGLQKLRRLWEDAIREQESKP